MSLTVQASVFWRQSWDVTRPLCWAVPSAREVFDPGAVGRQVICRVIDTPEPSGSGVPSSEQLVKVGDIWPAQLIAESRTMSGETDLTFPLPA